SPRGAPPADRQSRACRRSRQALRPSKPTQVGLEPRPSLRGGRLAAADSCVAGRAKCSGGTDMDTLLHQILAGLATGGIYASLALALVMIHQATHLLNFAQGEMAMFSTYIAWALINAGVPYWGAFVLTIAF